MSTERRPRRDAEENRRRLLTAAASAILREGRSVPLATIAAEAGVGIGTLYRSYPDREALLRALEHRAYGLLNNILDEIEKQGRHGLDAIKKYLLDSCAINDQLFLPLHGAPPLITSEALQARQSINERLESFLATARDDGTIRAAVNATDIIIFSALITKPLAHGPDWNHVARRQVAVFLNGLTVEGPSTLPDPPVHSADIERAFQNHE